jgi:arsenite-transporting ATPase
MCKSKRLYIFTGKGGVGKTTLSFSFSQHLKEQGKKVALVYFKNSKLDEEPTQYNEVRQLASEVNVEVIGLELLKSCQDYIAMKLKSKTVAHWIIKTPFFKSLINMIPGFNYLIYMGQILQLLSDDPDLVIILDSPSSGHALTMLEATKNFNEIFQSGMLHSDTQIMLDTLLKPDFTQINIITLPSLLAINESIELRASLNMIDKFENYIFCNNTLSSYQSEETPDFLKQKIANEVSAIDQGGEHIKDCIPYQMSSSVKEVIKDLVPSMENLV